MCCSPWGFKESDTVTTNIPAMNTRWVWVCRGRLKAGPRDESTLCSTVSVEVKVTRSCPTLCDPINSSLSDYSVPGILQARTLEWVAVSFSNA